MPLSVASSYYYITNVMMMAEEEIPDSLNPTEILSLSPSLQQSLEYILADFSPSQICNGPVAIFGPFL